MPKKVTLYTTTYCPFCTRAKDLLQSKGVELKEIDVSADAKAREEVQKKTGWMTVPMIFIGEEFIGGYQELEALEATGELDRKLSNHI